MKKLSTLAEPQLFARSMVVRTVALFGHETVVWFMGYDSNCYLGLDGRIYRSKRKRGYVDRRRYLVIDLYALDSSKLENIRDSLRQLAT